MSKILRVPIILVVYLLPVLASSYGTTRVFRERTDEVLKPFEALLDKLKDGAVVDTLGVGDADLLQFLNGVAAQHSAASQRLALIRYHQNLSVLISFVITALTILPFALIGARLAGNETRTRSANFDAARWRRALELANRSFFMKAMLASVISWTWFYLLNSRGITASIIHGFINEHLIVTRNSLPFLLERNFTLPPLLAAGLGFYLYVTGYFFNRARQNDLQSTLMYGVLFRKALFTAGITIVFSQVVGNQAVVVGFLVGLIPSSWVGMLKTLGTRSLDAVEDPAAAMRELPGMSRETISRLEEEGVDSITSLMGFNPADLASLLRNRPAMVDTWYDVAILINVVGLERYRRLKNCCLTARNFVKESSSDEFRKKIKDGAQIENADEIASILGVFLKQFDGKWAAKESTP